MILIHINVDDIISGVIEGQVNYATNHFDLGLLRWCCNVVLSVENTIFVILQYINQMIVVNK